MEGTGCCNLVLPLATQDHSTQSLVVHKQAVEEALIPAGQISSICVLPLFLSIFCLVQSWGGDCSDPPPWLA